MDGVNGPLIPTYIGSCYVDTSEDSIGTQNINIEISFTHRQTITPEYNIDKNVNAQFCIGKGELDSPTAKIEDVSVTPINKFQMHRLTSLHGTEMSYNVEQLNEIITECIVQEFKKFDKELISLHFKVQELTNHVAVLPKKIEQISKIAGDGSEIEMSLHHSIHDAIDD